MSKIEIDLSQMVTAEAQAAVDLAAIRATALAQLRAWLSTTARALTGDVTVEEMASWSSKAEAARAYIAGTATDAQTTMIEAEAAARGVAAPERAAVIAAKASQFEQASAVLAGLRGKVEAGIAAAGTAEDAMAAVAGAQAAWDAAMASQP